MKKEIKVADLDYPINLGETKTPNLEEWFCKCDVIQNMFESGKASVVEIKQDSGFVKRVVTYQMNKKSYVRSLHYAVH